MSTDFRVSVDFFTHHKTKKLIRRIGDAGVLALMRLWGYAAKHKPDGALLNMTVEDIEIAADWNGEDGVLVVALIEVGFIDESPCGVYELHDWRINNPWVFDAGQRSDAARLSKLAQVNADAHKELLRLGISGLTKEEYEVWKSYEPQSEPLAEVSEAQSDNTAVISDRTATASDRSANVSDSLAPSPSPSPSPSPDPEPKIQGQNTIAPLFADAAAGWDLFDASKPENPKGKPTAALDVTELERQCLSVLKGAAGGYKHDYSKDLDQIRRLSVDFPGVDMLEEVKLMSAWLVDKPPGRVKNSRAFFRNWITNSAKRGKGFAAAPSVKQLAEMDPDELVKEFYGGVRL